MNDIIRTEDILRGYASIHGHTLLNSQLFDIKWKCRENKPFAMVIGKRCGIRFETINMKNYYKSMNSLRHSIAQNRTVVLFCVPRDVQRLGVCNMFVRLTPENYCDIYARMDPVHNILIDKNPAKPSKREEKINLTAECRRHLRECVDYLQNRCMRADRQRPKKNRCAMHGFQRTYFANELMSRY